MRFRYFFIISIVLFIVTLTTIIGLYFIQKNERILSIDSQLYTTAQVLLSSGVLDSPHFDLKKAEKILELEVGQGQAENFFLVRNKAGTIIYKYNIQASEFEFIPMEELWHTINHPDKYIRVLSLQSPHLGDRSLQVGIIVNKQLVFPVFFSEVTWLTLLLSNLIGLFIAWFLANFLTSPIRRLSDFLNKNAQIKHGQFSLQTIPESQFQATPDSRDEFNQLLLSINSLIERINRGFQISRLWTYQMSHEIKTPLSVINSYMNRPPLLETESAAQIRHQIFKVSETVNAFLSWAEAQNVRPEVTHYIRISRLLNDCLQKVQDKIPLPIQLDVVDDFLVGINYHQMEQVFSNLIINAYEHGDKNKSISLSANRGCVVVSNHGSPFSPKILQNLGQPFNKGENENDGLFRGTGLGLAYVATVCEMNHFLLKIDHTDGLTTVAIDMSQALQK